MESSVPYLLPALLDWLVDNGCTPHLVLNTEHPEVRVPPGHATDGQIVLNISPTAVSNFELTREHVFFQTRFRGVPREIFAPLEAVLGIYARETGEGMAFVPRVVATIAPNTSAGQPPTRPRVVTGEPAREPSPLRGPSTGRTSTPPASGKDAGASGETGSERPGGKPERPALRLVRPDEDKD